MRAGGQEDSLHDAVRAHDGQSFAGRPHPNGCRRPSADRRTGSARPGPARTSVASSSTRRPRAAVTCTDSRAACADIRSAGSATIGARTRPPPSWRKSRGWPRGKSSSSIWRRIACGSVEANGGQTSTSCTIQARGKRPRIPPHRHSRRGRGRVVLQSARVAAGEYVSGTDDVFRSQSTSRIAGCGMPLTAGAEKRRGSRTTAIVLCGSSERCGPSRCSFAYSVATSHRTVLRGTRSVTRLSATRSGTHVRDGQR